MIKVDLITAIMLYLSTLLLSFFILWFKYEYSKKFYDLSIDKSNIWECEICNYTYVDSVHDKISKCPFCGSYNQKGEA